MLVGAKHLALHAAFGGAVRQGAERRALHSGAPGVNLVPGQVRPGKGLRRHGRLALGAALFGGKGGLGGQQAKAAQGLRAAAFGAFRVGQGLAQHLVAAAHPQHRRAALGQLADGCFQPALAQPQQVVHGIFCTGQDHAVWRAKLAGGLHIAHAKQRVLLQRHKVRKVGNMRQPHNGSIQRLDGIFDLQPVGKRILVLNIRL